MAEISGGTLEWSPAWDGIPSTTGPRAVIQAPRAGDLLTGIDLSFA